jgi:tRNA(Met) C34 N-acetyltransferase TmcA
LTVARLRRRARVTSTVQGNHGARRALLLSLKRNLAIFDRVQTGVRYETNPLLEQRKNDFLEVSDAASLVEVCPQGASRRRSIALQREVEALLRNQELFRLGDGAYRLGVEE